VGGINRPFLVLLVEWFVTHLQGPDHIHGLLGGLDRDEVHSEGGNKIIPGAIVDSVSLKDSILPISGPFSYGCSHFEVGQGDNNLLGVITVKVTV
jgi:hypothetical protein